MQDLHIHSLYSDGILAPAEIVRKAKERNLDEAAVSDHDTISGYPEAKEEGIKQNIRVIPSIELGSKVTFNNKSTDIDFLGINSGYEKMSGFSLPIRESRNRKTFAYIETINRIYRDNLVDELNASLGKYTSVPEAYKLKKAPISLTAKMMLENKFGRRMEESEAERICSASTLVAYDAVSVLLNGHMENPEALKQMHPKSVSLPLKEAIKQYLPKGIKEYRLSPAEAIKGILSCDGTPVIAHPARYVKFLEEAWLGKSGTGKLNPEEWIRELISHGLKGIEMYYYSANTFTLEYEMQANRYFKALADKYGLIITYGSDCHGEHGGAKELLGCFRPDYL